jgi:hypothetical protein
MCTPGGACTVNAQWFEGDEDAIHGTETDAERRARILQETKMSVAKLIRFEPPRRQIGC